MKIIWCSFLKAISLSSAHIKLVASYSYKFQWPTTSSVSFVNSSLSSDPARLSGLTCLMRPEFQFLIILRMSMSESSIDCVWPRIHG